jgi:hypothetical protein
MAPVVCIEPNGSQTLLLYDDAREDLKGQGWLEFLERFQGFNLQTTQEFSLSFDGCRAKVGDIQIEVTEEFLSKATGLPLSGHKWFKNAKVEEVSWSLFFTSRKIKCCDKGMPVSLLKTRWHGLLAILRQFVTCEGRFGLVFLYHIRLLMNFIGFQLNMPFYLLRSLYKMAKRFKRQRLNSSLFHHGLIRMLLVHQLKLQGDDWDTFLIRNGFVTPSPVEVDKPMLEETPIPSIDRTTSSSKEPCDRAVLDEPMPEQPDVEPTAFEFHDHEQYACPDTSAKNANRPSRKLSKNDSDVGFKNKRAGRLISRSLRNKSKSHMSSIKVIEVHESSDSEIEKFLAKEDPSYLKPDLSQAYDFVDNLPPCLKHSKGFPGIKLGKIPTDNSGNILTHDHGYPQTTVPDPRCDVCLFWIDKYYTDVPSLQLQIKTLSTQINSLTSENHRLKFSAQRQGKRLKRTGNVIIKNVESVTTVVNSEIL